MVIIKSEENNAKYIQQNNAKPHNISLYTKFVVAASERDLKHHLQSQYPNNQDMTVLLDLGFFSFTF